MNQSPRLVVGPPNLKRRPDLFDGLEGQPRWDRVVAISIDLALWAAVLVGLKFLF